MEQLLREQSQERKRVTEMDKAVWSMFVYLIVSTGALMFVKNDFYHDYLADINDSVYEAIITFILFKYSSEDKKMRLAAGSLLVFSGYSLFTNIINENYVYTSWGIGAIALAGAIFAIRKFK